MAVSKIQLYDNALLLLGQRKLTGLTEEREPRYLLDDAYDLDATAYCLEVTRPSFASKTVKLDNPAVSAVHDLDSVHALPADFITIVRVYSDAKLDQPISRYFIEANTLVCEYDTVYLRYTSDDHVAAFTDWSPSFTRVVSAYLAREICIKVNPKEYDTISNLFLDRVEVVKGLEAEKEPAERSSATTVTLTNEWRKIYNDALFIMGLDEITSNTDDSNRRTKLDRALDAGIVSSLLEDIGWTFALTSTESTYTPSVEPAWGYSRAHAKPNDMHRLDGIYQDEYMQFPLKHYMDEDGYFFTDEDTFYIQYVSDSWLATPSSWPTFFKRLVAAKMAADTALSLRGEGSDPDKADATFAEREGGAKSNDAMSSPPRMLARGKWGRARYTGGNRGRP